MDKKHTGAKKTYLVTSEFAYDWHYPRGVVDEIHFGYTHPDGGTSGSIIMEWRQLESGKPPVPRLCCFNDGWHALAQFKDVIDLLAEHDDEDITPKQFCQLLEQCGFVDRTQRQQ